MSRSLSVPILGFVGMFAALVLGLALGSPNSPTAPVQVKTNMELLGEVTTVVRPDDPLVRELREDDARRELEQRDAWK